MRSPRASARAMSAVRAATTVICCPTMARTSISCGSADPGTRMPGVRATSGASSGCAQSASSIASGSASRSKMRRTVDTSGARSPSRATRARRCRRAVSSWRTSNQAGPPDMRRCRENDVAVTSSIPGTARAAIQAKMPLASSGPRYGSTRSIAPGAADACDRRRALSSPGVSAKTSRIVSLHWRMLAKPAEKATSEMGMSVPTRSIRAVCARCALANARGPAPSSVLSRRVRCLLEYPRRAANPGTPSRSTTPSEIRRIARAAVSPRMSHAGEPGAASGRHRLHARYPASCAAALVG